MKLHRDSIATKAWQRHCASSPLHGIAAVLLLFFSGCTTEHKPPTDAGILPVLSVPIGTAPQGLWLISHMEELGAELDYSKFYQFDSTDVDAVPLVQSQTDLEFSGGKLDSLHILSTSIRILGGKVVEGSFAIDGFTQNSPQTLGIYQRACALLSEQYGNPVWSGSVSDLSFRATALSDTERPFFAIAASDWLAGTMPPQSTTALQIPQQRSEMQLWRWQDPGGTWAIACRLVPMVPGTDFAEDPVQIRIRLLPRINDEWKAKERAYTGWIQFGSCTLPEPGLVLCEHVSNAELQNIQEATHPGLPFLRENNRPLYFYSGSYGITQLAYAHDTSRFGPYDAHSLDPRFGTFFIRFRGIIIDSSRTRLQAPIAYITQIEDIRYPEEADCPQANHR